MSSPWTDRSLWSHYHAWANSMQSNKGNMAGRISPCQQQVFVERGIGHQTRVSRAWKRMAFEEILKWKAMMRPLHPKSMICTHKDSSVLKKAQHAPCSPTHRSSRKLIHVVRHAIPPKSYQISNSYLAFDCDYNINSIPSWCCSAFLSISSSCLRASNARHFV